MCVEVLYGLDPAMHMSRLICEPGLRVWIGGVGMSCWGRDTSVYRAAASNICTHASYRSFPKSAALICRPRKAPQFTATVK